MSDNSWAYRHPANGEWVPRLTRVLDIFADADLSGWRDRVGKDEAARVKAATSRIGKGCHARIQQRLERKKVSRAKPLSEIARAFEAWDRWRIANPFKATRTEQLLFSPLGFAGTPDCLEDMAMGAPINRTTEWKITSTIQPKHWLQVNAQVALAWPRLIGCVSLDDRIVRLDGPVPTCRIVRVDPFLGIVEPREEPFRPRLLLTFLHMLAVYRDLFFEPELLRRSGRMEIPDDGDDERTSDETDAAARAD